MSEGVALHGLKKEFRNTMIYLEIYMLGDCLRSRSPEHPEGQPGKRKGKKIEKKLQKRLEQ